MIQLPLSFFISDNQLPELRLEPSPSSPQAQDNKRKREMIFDYVIELDDKYVKLSDPHWKQYSYLFT